MTNGQYLLGAAICVMILMDIDTSLPRMAHYRFLRTFNHDIEQLYLLYIAKVKKRKSIKYQPCLMADDNEH